MRPLPLNLRDTYGHVRMAVYSAGLDVEIRSADHLPNGMMGCYSECMSWSTGPTVMTGVACMRCAPVRRRLGY